MPWPDKRVIVPTNGNITTCLTAHLPCLIGAVQTAGPGWNI